MHEKTRQNELRDDELKTVSGGNGLLAHFVPGLAEDEANVQKNDMSGGTVSGMACPRCGFRMKPTVPIQGLVPSGPGFVCTTCGHTL